MAANGVFLVLTVLVASVASEAMRPFVLPVLSRGNLRDDSLRAVEPDTKCTNDNKGLTCSNCTTVRQCTKFGANWFLSKETACGGKTPWCLEGKCVADQPTTGDCNKPSTSSDFQCTSDGYFPDMASCTKYYLCVGGTALAYDCSAYPGTQYDHRTAMCLARAKAGACFTLRCPNPANQAYQTYSPAPWVYASCTDNKPANALVGACSMNQAWNGTDCAVACQSAGRFLDAAAGGGNHFYECVDLGNNKYSDPMPGECPSGTTFNESQGKCVVNNSGGGNP